MQPILHASREAVLLQSEIHNELTRRGTVEADDQTMAEYVTVLCINEKPIDQIGQELADIGGAEFDASFLTWLSDRVTSIKSGTTSFDIPQPAAPIVSAATEPVSTRQPRGDSGNRLLSHALAPIASDQRTGPSGQKRGLSPAAYDGGNKRRSTGLPSGPKAMRNDDEDVSMNDDLIDGRRGTRNEGSRSLMERIGEPGLPNGSVVDTTGATRPLRNMRGRGGPRMGMMNRGAPPHMGRMTPMEMQMQAQFLAMQRQQMAGMHRGGGFPMAPMGGGMIDPMAMQGMFMQQQEQMQQMQAMMEQMAQAVQNGGGMSQPVRPKPPTAQPAQKIGEYTITARRGVTPTTKGREATAIPDKPLSSDLCKFGVGCTNIRCQFSHPSPAATESSGIVLKTEACPQGKACKDSDCPYSHVSPAQVHGEGAGERRVLCKFPVCTNPSCQFRHEDAEGNPIPPPALTRAVKKNEDGNEVDMDAEHDEWDVKVGEGTAFGLGNAKSESEVRMQLDNPLGDSKKPVATKPLNGTIATPCRFGSGCTNKFCKFTHPIDTPCRFGSRCFKEDCPYSHPPGRKTASVFPPSAHQNKSVSFNPTAPSFKPGQHISQRKFVDESQPVTKLMAEGEPEIDVKVEEIKVEEAANGGKIA